MIRIAFALMFALTLAAATPADAQEDPIQGVISSQIEAFKADDFETAWTYASPMIQRLFGTPDRFGMMVRQGYPMVWRPAEVTWLEQRAEGPFTNQDVLIRDADGAFHTLRYQMIQTENGWQINGVEFLQAPQAAA